MAKSLKFGISREALGFCLLIFTVISFQIPAFALPASHLLGIPFAYKCNNTMETVVPLSKDTLLAAVMILYGHRDLRLLSSEVKEELAALGEVPQSQLVDEKVLDKIFDKLHEPKPYYLAGTEDENDIQLATVIGKQALGAKQALDRTSDRSRSIYDKDPLYDLRDMVRGYGWRLLPKYDKAFKDPVYLARLLRFSGATGVGVDTEFDYSPLSDFQKTWETLAPDSKPVYFALNGSSANNVLYEIAQKVTHREDAEILYFANIYGAGQGRLAKASFIDGGSQRSYEAREYRIKNPVTYEIDPQDPAEVARVAKDEDVALEKIRDTVKNGSKPIGGILIEPILGAKGVFFYRTEFLLRLRALCDELGIPIFADEILTGGGRTGKFFAYQHYQGFLPDYITFGKGFQVSGIAFVSRLVTSPGGMRVYPEPDTGTVTLRQYAEPLIKGTQIMKRIRDDHLIENAQVVGAYFIEKLKEYKQWKIIGGYLQRAEITAVRGQGLLISAADADLRLTNALGPRLMPYLTLTKQDVDFLIEEAKARILAQHKKTHLAPKVRGKGELKIHRE